MNRVLRGGVAVAGVCFLAVAGATAGRYLYAHTPPALLPFRELTPAREFFRTRPLWRGTGREERDPAVERVRIGIIGPFTANQMGAGGGNAPAVGDDPMLPYGRSLLEGARLAVDAANAAGGYRGRPFELVLRSDRVLWGQTSNELAHFKYDDRVWAVLGTINSNHAHVMVRAALKVEIPIVNPGTTDPTLTEHTIPWLVRVMPDDRQQAYLLLRYLFAERGYTRVVVLRRNDRDARAGMQEFVTGAERLGHPVLMELRYLPNATDFGDALTRLEAQRPEAIVLWGDPPDMAQIVRQIRARRMAGEIAGFSRMALPEFAELAGAAAEGVVAATVFNPEQAGARGEAFRAAYRARYQREPNVYARFAYDGAGLIVQAIRTAGLNRTRIRDALFAVEHYDGAAGRLMFDATLNNVSPPWLARRQRGEWHYFRPTADFPGVARP